MTTHDGATIHATAATRTGAIVTTKTGSRQAVVPVQPLHETTPLKTIRGIVTMIREGSSVTLTHAIEMASIRATCSSEMSTCRAGLSGKLSTMRASASTRCGARRPAPFQRLARFVWSQRATFETTTADLLIHVRATSATCANRGWFELSASTVIGTMWSSSRTVVAIS